MIEALEILKVDEIHTVYEQVLAEVGYYEKQSPQIDELIEYGSYSCKSKHAQAPYPRPKGIEWLKNHLEYNK